MTLDNEGSAADEGVRKELALVEAVIFDKGKLDRVTDFKSLMRMELTGETDK